MVDRQAQIDFILDHYENPRRYGPLAQPTISQKGVNPGCGDVVIFHVLVEGGARIADLAFEGEGCTISQAGASLAAEMFYGKTLAEVEAAPADAILDALGRDLSGARLKCALLGFNTLKDALRALRQQPRPTQYT